MNIDWSKQVTTGDESQTALHYAVQSRDHEIMKALLSVVAETNENKDENKEKEDKKDQDADIVDDLVDGKKEEDEKKESNKTGLMLKVVVDILHH